MDWNFIRDKNDWSDKSALYKSALCGSLCLDNLVLGKAIAKGCNGVVYEAKLKPGEVFFYALITHPEF